MPPASVFLIDDNSQFLTSLRGFLVSHRNLVNVVDSAPSAEEALPRIAVLKPDILLLDLFLPGMNGIEFLPQVALASPATAVIVLTFYEFDEYRQAALQAGAIDLIPKARLGERLIPAIQSALKPVLGVA